MKTATKKKSTKSNTPTRKKSTPKSSKETLTGILEDMLKDTYWAEKHLTKALPKMAKAAQSEQLKSAFEGHLKETEQHVSRLEKCFELMEKKPVAKKCEAMEGLVKEGAEIIEDHAKGDARDAALIAAAQKVEHYEMSTYGTMRTMANVLGYVECAKLFEKTKDEEYGADEKLSQLADKINQLAAQDHNGVE